MLGYFLMENSFFFFLTPRELARLQFTTCRVSWGTQQSFMWDVNNFLCQHAEKQIQGIPNYQHHYFFTLMTVLWTFRSVFSLWPQQQVTLTAFTFWSLHSQYNFNVVSGAGVFNKYTHCKINFCHIICDWSWAGAYKISSNICAVWFLAHCGETAQIKTVTWKTLAKSKWA